MTDIQTLFIRQYLHEVCALHLSGLERRVQSSYCSRKKNSLIDVQGPIVPPGGHQLEEVVDRVRGVRDDLVSFIVRL